MIPARPQLRNEQRQPVALVRITPTWTVVNEAPLIEFPPHGVTYCAPSPVKVNDLDIAARKDCGNDRIDWTRCLAGSNANPAARRCLTRFHQALISRENHGRICTRLRNTIEPIIA